MMCTELLRNATCQQWGVASTVLGSPDHSSDAKLRHQYKKQLLVSRQQKKFCPYFSMWFVKSENFFLDLARRWHIIRIQFLNGTLHPRWGFIGRPFLPAELFGVSTFVLPMMIQVFLCNPIWRCRVFFLFYLRFTLRSWKC